MPLTCPIETELLTMEFEMNRLDWEEIFSGPASDKTIRLVPINKYIDYRDILEESGYEYVKQFGEVESTSMQYGKYGVYYILVHFEDAENVNRFLKRGHCTIFFHKFEVKPPLDQIHQSTTNIISKHLENLSKVNETVPAEDSPHNIMNALDDECLCLIFERIHELTDFISLTNVCWRFKRITKRISNSKMKEIGTIRFTYLIIENKIPLSQMEDFLCEFGSSILSVSLDYYLTQHISNAPNILLKMIHKFCKNIKKLELCDFFDITKQTLFEIQPLLSKLKDLTIIQCLNESIFMEFTSFLSACSQLECFIFNTTAKFQYQYVLPAITFPNLKIIHLNNEMSCDAFLEHNPQIEALRINYMENICHFVAKNMPNLRDFELNNCSSLTENDVIHLKYHENLKVSFGYVHIDASIRNIFPMKCITTLYLIADTPFYENLLIELSKSLYNLKHLHIRMEHKQSTISTAKLKQMLQYANQLSELHLNWPNNFLYYFDERDYYDILEIVKNRTNQIKLNIHIVCTTSMFLVCTGYRHKSIYLNKDPAWLSVSLNYGDLKF